MESLYTTNLPQFAYTAEQVQNNEKQVAEQLGFDLSEVMQKAGAAVFQYIEHHYGNHRRLLILLGKGNNAGDGYIVAYLAQQNGYQVTLVSFVDVKSLHGDALGAYLQCQQAGLAVCQSNDLLLQELSAFDLVVDAMFGTGFKGELPEHFGQVCTLVNQHDNLPVISIDVPSGVNAASAAVANNAIKANVTITFIALKQGLLTGRALEHVGKLVFAGLALDELFRDKIKSNVTRFELSQLKKALPNRALAAYKNQLGHVLCIGGNKGMAGAIRLSAEAALRSGAGLVSVATHPDNCAAVLQGRYELMVHGIDAEHQLLALINKASVVVIGPGLGQDVWAQNIWQWMMNAQCLRLVIDADGLNFLAKSDKCTTDNLTERVLTPHAGEAARLLGISNRDVEQDRFDSALQLSQRYNAISLLKGPGSLVSAKGCLNINQTGSAALASAGMGDVLSGIIAGLMAQQMTGFTATKLAAAIHGAAADNLLDEGARGLLASDLFPQIRRLIG
ncbi:NAD(P)H-hydrate dehydratase [Pseudoalteromonas tunicata]|uniref:NAD(P)H-hydrate dehydratase n=1 Tax=Pseudoalteromonas tunicata TaxID=314281 RepID=UPI00273D0D30|nr:NAD(P)H-hydrate dehydratase [Pseudoalteromonas tunicata]MDP5211713.1 NAD(P)H-hydrate dehydratase [Pseudoalteromonas tunicata]